MTAWVTLSLGLAGATWIQAYRLWFDRDADAPVTNDDDHLARLTQRIARWAHPDDAPSRERIRLRLVRAGFPQRHAAEVFAAARTLVALAVPLLVLPPIASMLRTDVALALALGLAALGYYLPALALNARIAARRQRLLRPFPDALDLLVSSVEAGLGLDAALRRVAVELAPAAPDLARELQRVNTEIAAGIQRLQAMRNLAIRTGLDEAQTLVNLLVQADRFGTAIARSLRVHAQSTRQRRMARAEEDAAKIPPKLTVVMILFLLPCLFVVLIGPAAINVRHALWGN